MKESLDHTLAKSLSGHSVRAVELISSFLLAFLVIQIFFSGERAFEDFDLGPKTRSVYATLWGLIHATFIFVERISSKASLPLPQPLKSIALHWVTLYLAMLSWIPFRSRDLVQTFGLYGAFCDANRFFKMNLHENNYLLAFVLLLGFNATYFYASVMQKFLLELGWYSCSNRGLHHDDFDHHHFSKAD